MSGGLDRLGELRGDNVAVEQKTDMRQIEENADIAEHMQLYEPVAKGLELISKNVGMIQALKDKERNITNDGPLKVVRAQLSALMSSSTGTAGQIKATLDKIKQVNVQFEKDNSESAKVRIFQNLYDTRVRRFHQVMNDYNAASHEFKTALQNRTRRQLRIVDSKMSEEDIEKIVQSGQAEAGVIKKALISSNVKTTVQSIEERHLEILKLEQQVLEVYELFRDLATLVDIQQESLDVIENRIKGAKHYTEKGEKSLVKSEEYGKKARKRQCCLLLILLAIVIAIILPILSSLSSDA